jgi:hypothetical protein
LLDDFIKAVEGLQNKHPRFSVCSISISLISCGADLGFAKLGKAITGIKILGENYVSMFNKRFKQRSMRFAARSGLGYGV